MCPCFWHPDPVHSVCKPVCLSRPVVETCPAPSLMVLCSTCRLKSQRSTAPEADSHKQKLCVYWHQAKTSLSLVGGGRSGGDLIGPGRHYITPCYFHYYCDYNTLCKVSLQYNIYTFIYTFIYILYIYIFVLDFKKHISKSLFYAKEKCALKSEEETSEDKTESFNVCWNTCSRQLRPSGLPANLHVCVDNVQQAS